MMEERLAHRRRRATVALLRLLVLAILGVFVAGGPAAILFLFAVLLRPLVLLVAFLAGAIFLPALAVLLIAALPAFLAAALVVLFAITLVAFLALAFVAALRVFTLGGTIF